MDFAKLGSSFHRPLLVVLAVSLLLKLSVWCVVVFTGDPVRDFSWADTRGYHEPALSLVQSGRFDTFLDAPGQPMTYRTPGYPAFLAAVYAVFGENQPAAILFQVLLSLVTIYLTWRLAWRLWGDQVALSAAALLALDPLSLTYSLKIMTENNFTLFVMVAILAGVNLVTNQRRRAGWALLLGLTLALATLTRPLSYYLPIPVILGVMIWGWKRRWGARSMAVTALLILLPNLLLIGGWTWRNFRLTGAPVYTSIEGYYTYFWQAANVIAERDGLEIDKVQLQLGMGSGGPTGRGSGYREAHPETKDWTFEQLCQRWQKEGMEVIKAHPLIFAKVYFAGVARALLRPGAQQLLEMLGVPLSALNPRSLVHRPLAAGFLIYSYLYLLLLYLGFVLYFIRGRRTDKMDVARFFILGIFLYVILASGGPSAISRFRIPLMPLFALFSAYQITRTLQRSPKIIKRS
jgi:4-amino-4-deoxy-L-arabinose transferase-like glycosyltransferase